MAVDFQRLPLAGKLILAAAVPGVLALLGFVAVVQPQRSGLAAAQTRFERLQRDLQAAERQQQQYLQLKETLNRRAESDARNRRVLPETGEIATFLQDLNRLAELNGLKLRLVEPLAEEPEALYVRMPVKLAMSGRYHQIAKFFVDVAQVDRAISMENVSLSAAKAAPDEPLLQVDVRAITFRLQTAEKAAEAAKPLPTKRRKAGAARERGAP